MCPTTIAFPTETRSSASTWVRETIPGKKSGSSCKGEGPKLGCLSDRPIPVGTPAWRTSLDDGRQTGCFPLPFTCLALCHGPVQP